MSLTMGWPGSPGSSSTEMSPGFYIRARFLVRNHQQRTTSIIGAKQQVQQMPHRYKTANLNTCGWQHHGAQRLERKIAAIANDCTI